MLPYDKKNNDTYIEKYSNDMVLDTEIHMFKNPRGNVVAGAGIIGDFSVESRIAAKNNVLKFPKASDLGLKNLKSIELRQLIPLSLKKRYNKSLGDNIHAQKTPIYYNIETYEFLIPSDYRFLRDLKQLPQFKKSIDNLIKNNEIRIYPNLNDEMLFLSFTSLKNIENNYNEKLKKLNELYINSTLETYPNEDVIIITYQLDNNQKTISEGLPKGGSEIFNFVKNSTIDFYFIKAKLVENSGYYIYDDNNILTNKIIYLNKKSRDSIKQEKNNLFYIGSNSDFLSIPYSQDDWNKLIKLKKEITSIFLQLNSILKKQKTNNLLDNPINKLEQNSLKLISSNPTNKKP